MADLVGGHLGDLVSALVDGELHGPDAAAAHRHLSGCDQCRDEYTATEAVARTVRGLPPVDPRFGFYERLTRRGGFGLPRRSVRIGIAVATAAAMVAVAVAVAGDLSEVPVSPPVDDMMAVHQAGFLPPVAADKGFEESTAGDMGAPFEAPGEVGAGYERRAVYERKSDHIMAVAYRADGGAVSVFEQTGVLDTEALDASMAPVAGDAWAMESNGVLAVVYVRGRLVYTVVGEAPMASLMAVVRNLPGPPSPSIWQRARNASAEVVWTFGLGN